ncbi:protein of unknown function [Nitrosomonas sp. Nm166]|nr:protein of unknown function [Nitrosomonas sp. Nm166]
MLTDVAVRQAKAKDKPYKISDSGRLYLLVNAIGKYWRMNYRFAGKQKTLAIGVYPAVSLVKPRFSIRTDQGVNIGLNLTGRSNVLDLSQRPSIHSRCCMATARLIIFFRPS